MYGVDFECHGTASKGTHICHLPSFGAAMCTRPLTGLTLHSALLGLQFHIIKASKSLVFYHHHDLALDTCI